MNEHVREIREIVAGILWLPAERVDCHCALSQLPQWDSLTHLTLMMIIEERSGREISADQFSSSASVADIAAALHPLHPTLH